MLDALLPAELQAKALEWLGAEGEQGLAQASLEEGHGRIRVRMHARVAMAVP